MATTIHRARGVLRATARAGYGARGLVYLIVGGFALVAALGKVEVKGSRSAIAELFRAPGGTIILLAVTLGLTAHAVWRAVQALLDADGHGLGVKGVLVRGMLAGSGAIHAGLAFFAFDLAVGPLGGSSSASEDEGAREWTAWLLGQPFGPWLVGAAGGILGIIAVAHFVKAWTASFVRRLEIDRGNLRWARPVGRAGLAARGCVFALMGAFLVIAARSGNPGEARGLEGALRALGSQPFGAWLLGAAGVGLVAFAAYSLIEAAWRRIDMPRMTPG